MLQFFQGNICLFHLGFSIAIAREEKPVSYLGGGDTATSMNLLAAIVELGLNFRCNMTLLSLSLCCLEICSIF